jgi:hypothetical protein
MKRNPRRRRVLRRRLGEFILWHFKLMEIGGFSTPNFWLTTPPLQA